MEKWSLLPSVVGYKQNRRVVHRAKLSKKNEQKGAFFTFLAGFLAASRALWYKVPPLNLG